MSDSKQLRVFKFGGTSVLDADRIFKVVELVSPAVREGISPIVVVSAFGGVTDRLLEMAELATAGDPGWEEALKEIEERHRATLDRLAEDHVRDELDARISGAVEELEKLGRGISLVGECSRRIGDRLLSFGERLSAPLVAAAFRTRGVDADAVDAREIVVTDDNFGAARVLREETEERARKRLGKPGPVRVVTGFLGATVDGETTTLGRGGSDYTATLLGAALKVDRVEIWTDVDGIMSADPRIVPDAFSLEAVT
ncbi:MAG: aspartate kinase, partial [Longimicrobiales bacterium]